ncbi:MAG: DUF2569 family protein [Bacteroidota bacterium]
MPKWFSLVGVLFVFFPLNLLFDLLFSNDGTLGQNRWDQLANLYQGSEYSFAKNLLTAEIIFLTLLLVFSIWLLVQFWKQRSSFPRWLIAFLAFAWIGEVVISGLRGQVLGEDKYAWPHDAERLIGYAFMALAIGITIHLIPRIRQSFHRRLRA